ncbi:MAG: tRNA(fMet)-specific endonuclease VapC [Deltaproteobacteria bacterium ADurb.BinA179]|jgi:predicted nucleic acid-binding protein|nr:MAG: tRNA(fMet)-specific endonuclease VapC [Deltaproteobacteria bacterium ADurb.BinA179]HOD72806.1 type II toxin-antitoxin system VapC family toxin [Deltaproteobacteria bacterium]HOE73988.1 type II toxin-antitoxin system VapC family toxin [Deltaproteobacteria bacterium]HON39719.1 type II toxin-antitoxin system VapC family toxin [Deltaproteobacteria bacterium]HPL88039.1 type II toxin-antitoxin system VapC family toxin [Deltaproteobacteria bacterium]
MWVVDASVAVRWFLEDEKNVYADEVLARLVDEPTRFSIPELFCFEVYSVLCRVHPAGQEVFETGLVPLLTGGMFRQPMDGPLAARAATYVRAGLTGYDACYAALAEDVGGTWLTFDAKAHKMLSKMNISHLLSKGLPDTWFKD